VLGFITLKIKNKKKDLQVASFTSTEHVKNLKNCESCFVFKSISLKLYYFLNYILLYVSLFPYLATIECQTYP